MKYWLTFLILFVFSHQAFLNAQTDSISPKSPICKAGFYLGTNYTVPKDANFSDPSYSLAGKPEWGYELGVRTIFRLSRFFLFSSGFSYGELHYHTNLSGENQYNIGNPYTLDESTKEYSFNMPLTLLAHLHSGKFDCYAGIGEEVTMFYKYLDEGNVTMNGQKNPFSNMGLRNSVLESYLRPGLTLGMNYRKNSRLDFFAEAAVKDVKFGYGYFENLYTVYCNAGVMYSLFFCL